MSEASEFPAEGQAPERGKVSIEIGKPLPAIDESLDTIGTGLDKVILNTIEHGPLFDTTQYRDGNKRLENIDGSKIIVYDASGDHLVLDIKDLDSSTLRTVLGEFGWPSEKIESEIERIQNERNIKRERREKIISESTTS